MAGGMYPEEEVRLMVGHAVESAWGSPDGATVAEITERVIAEGPEPSPESTAMEMLQRAKAGAVGAHGEGQLRTWALVVIAEALHGMAPVTAGVVVDEVGEDGLPRELTDRLVEFFSGTMGAYRAVNLREALKIAPSTGDWHGELGFLLDALIPELPEQTPNVPAEQQQTAKQRDALYMALEGADTDGAHHKQWALVRLCKLLGASEGSLAQVDPGIAP